MKLKYFKQWKANMFGSAILYFKIMMPTLDASDRLLNHQQQHNARHPKHRRYILILSCSYFVWLLFWPNLCAFSTF